MKRTIIIQLKDIMENESLIHIEYKDIIQQFNKIDIHVTDIHMDESNGDTIVTFDDHYITNSFSKYKKYNIINPYLMNIRLIDNLISDNIYEGYRHCVIHEDNVKKFVKNTTIYVGRENQRKAIFNFMKELNDMSDNRYNKVPRFILWEVGKFNDNGEVSLKILDYNMFVNYFEIEYSVTGITHMSSSPYDTLTHYIKYNELTHAENIMSQNNLSNFINPLRHNPILDSNDMIEDILNKTSPHVKYSPNMDSSGMKKVSGALDLEDAKIDKIEALKAWYDSTKMYIVEMLGSKWYTRKETVDRLNKRIHMWNSPDVYPFFLIDDLGNMMNERVSTRRIENLVKRLQLHIDTWENTYYDTLNRINECKTINDLSIITIEIVHIEEEEEMEEETLVKEEESISFLFDDFYSKNTKPKIPDVPLLKVKM